MKIPSGKVAEGRQLSPRRWSGVRSISLAQQLNEQVIECCSELSSDAMAWNQVSLTASHRDLWSQLDPIARKRLSLFPFVIVDLRFGDVTWWRMAAGHGAYVRNPSYGPAPAARWDWLALESLMFAWQVAREDRSVAAMLFAMPSPVAECIAALTMQQVRAVASTTRLRLRWDHHPYLWRQLLRAAREPDEEELSTYRRAAILSFCGELIRAQCVASAPMPWVAGTEMSAVKRH